MITLKSLLESIKRKETITEDLRSDEDDYYYHVTLAPHVQRIKQSGLKVHTKKTVSNYSSYSKGKIFFTNIGALDWWTYTIAAHAFHDHDDEAYHDIAIFKVLKKNLPDVNIDKVGSDDSRGNSYYVTNDVPPNIIEFVKLVESPY